MAGIDKQRVDLSLKVVTPTGTAMETACDAVHLTAADGSLGIRRGHLPALILLARGPVMALRGGKILSRLELEGGFATVDNDEVTVLASGIVPE